MLTKITNRGLAWIDLESPTQEEIQSVAKDYGLNPLVVHELSSPSLRAKVDLYQTFIYLILHFPKTRRSKGEHDQEIDFIIGKKFLITVHYRPNETLHYVWKIFETSATLQKGEFGTHAGFILFFLLQKLYETLIRELASVQESLRLIEERIYRGEERDMVVLLSETSRDLLYFKRSLTLHLGVLESFEIGGQKLLGAGFAFHLRALLGDYARVEHSVQSNAEFLSELRETNNALLSAKHNEIMRTLTILAFIALPATTVLSLFQVNTVARPIVGLPFDFWILVGMVAAIAFGLYSWFKRRKWL